MDAAGALADLTEISSQVETAVLLDGDGAILASTFPAAAAAEPLARAARELLAEAGGIGLGVGRELTQLEVSLREGSVFVVRDGARIVAATTVPEPTSALILYDLRACLRGLAESEAADAGGEAAAAPAEDGRCVGSSRSSSSWAGRCSFSCAAAGAVARA